MAIRPNTNAPLLLELHNPYPHKALFQLVIYWGSLPKTAQLYLAPGEMSIRGPLASTKKGDLERVGLELGVRKDRELFKTPLEEHCGRRIQLDRVYRLFPDQNRKTTLPEILIEPENPAVIALKVVLTKKLDGAPPQFDVVQMAGTRVVGGCTFMMRRV